MVHNTTKCNVARAAFLLLLSGVSLAIQEHQAASCNLEIGTICADRIGTGCLQAERAHINQACIPSLVSQEICGQQVEGASIYANRAQSRDLCSENGYIGNLCSDRMVTNTLFVQNLETCVKYRAQVIDTIPHTYFLGSNILFNTIVDDPNNNIQQSAFTSYIVPVTGYYNLSARSSVSNLSGPFMFGIPMLLLGIYANNRPLITENGAFLAFNNIQNMSASGMALLQAGDVITVKLSLQVLNFILGRVTDYSGTLVINAGEPGNLTIYFLSPLACAQPGPQSCMQPCPPHPVVCAACDPVDCGIISCP